MESMLIDGKDITTLVNYAKHLGVDALTLKLSKETKAVLLVEHKGKPRMICPIDPNKCHTQNDWIGTIPLTVLDEISETQNVCIRLLKQISFNKWVMEVDDGQQKKKCITYGATIHQPTPIIFQNRTLH